MFRVLLRIHCHSAEFSERYHQIESRFRGAERVKVTRNWIFSENFNTKTVQHLIQKTIMFGGVGYRMLSHKIREATTGLDLR